jgi:hypothetical protein
MSDVVEDVTVTVTKGTRVRVERFRINDQPHSLSGGSMKFDALHESFTGAIRHIRGDHPTESTSFAFWVEPDSDAEKYGAEMCEKCNVLEVGPLHQSQFWPLKEGA